MKKKFIIFFIFPVLSFSQVSSDREKLYVKAEERNRFHKEFIEVSLQPVDNINQLYKLGEECLKIAANDDEKARSYSMMGDAKRKKMEYSQAVGYFQKADFYARKNNFDSERFLINVLLSDTYSNLNLKVQAGNAANEALAISQKLNDPEKTDLLYHQKAINLMREEKYCEAIHYQSKSYYYNFNKYEEDATGNSKYNFLAHCTTLSYLFFKCGNIAEAKKYLEIFEENYNPSTDIKETYTLESYYMNKGILYALENKNNEAKLWFDRSIKRAMDENKNKQLIRIIKERLLYIQDSESNKRYFEQYLALYNQKSREIETVSQNEFTKQEQSLNQQRINIFMLIGLSVVLGVVIVVISFYYTKRKKETKLRFDQIIKTLEQQDLERLRQISHTDASQKEMDIETHLEEANNAEENKKIMSESKEKELLEKLIAFEAGTKFTARNFTISNLASILDTNTKYTNYILKNHRGENFNAYINGLKISYIVNLLYKNPSYLNYKITHLSDLSGFSSHSRFTHIFKQKLNISPSEFISRLKEKADKTNMSN